MKALLAPPRVGATRRAAARLFPLVSLSPLLPLVLLFFFQLGARDLVSSHEARAAQNAQRMLDTGEWGLPTLFDGQPDLQKPPGYYWLVAAAGWLNGKQVTPWVARFPAALSAVLAVLLVYSFLRREGYRTGATVAAVALATANHFVAIGRTARIDVPLTLCVAAALVRFYRGVGEPRGSSPRPCGSRNPPAGMNPAARFAVAALFAGFAVLLKGPVALALVGPVAVALLMVEHRRIPLFPALIGGAVVAAVALPWFVWANRATDGEFFRVFFWHHNVERFTGESDSLASHPWWYYGPRFAFAFLPWTLPLVTLSARTFATGAWREDRLFRFGVVWAAVVVAVLSAARFKRADYLLPAFPGAAIALGCAAQRWLSSGASQRAVRRKKWIFGVLLTCGLAVWPVMWVVVEPKQAAREDKQAFAAAIRGHSPKPQTILLFRAESHLLAYHLGSPIHTLVEWGELKERLSAPGPHAVVMPPDYAAEAERITGRKLVPVATLAEYLTVRPPRPLVCLRTAD